jgi:glycosyltransferase involved in cell wall biosynthesis
MESWHAHSRELGVAGDVEWLGFKEGEELESLYRGCLAVINPSLLNETFGLVCLESLARARPVIASRTGALPEVVSDQVDGLLVTPGDPAALAAAMERLAQDPAEAREKGRRGQEKVKNDFSRARHYQGLTEVYREVMHEA